MEAGLLWMGLGEDEEEGLGERKKKKGRKSNLPLLNDLFLLILP